MVDSAATATEEIIQRPNSKVGGIAADKLSAFVQRIEALAEEKATISNDIKEIYSEAKGHGFAVGIIRKVVQIRKKDRDDAREERELTDLYLEAVGSSL